MALDRPRARQPQLLSLKGGVCRHHHQIPGRRAESRHGLLGLPGGPWGGLHRPQPSQLWQGRAGRWCGDRRALSTGRRVLRLLIGSCFAGEGARSKSIGDYYDPFRMFGRSLARARAERYRSTMNEFVLPFNFCPERARSSFQATRSPRQHDERKRKSPWPTLVSTYVSFHAPSSMQAQLARPRCDARAFLSNSPGIGVPRLHLCFGRRFGASLSCSRSRRPSALYLFNASRHRPSALYLFNASRHRPNPTTRRKVAGPGLRVQRILNPKRLRFGWSASGGWDLSADACVNGCERTCALNHRHPKLKRGRRPIRAPERAEAPSQGKAVPEQAVECNESTRDAQPRGHDSALASDSLP